MSSDNNGELIRSLRVCVFILIGVNVVLLGGIFYMWRAVSDVKSRSNVIREETNKRSEGIEDDIVKIHGRLEDIEEYLNARDKGEFLRKYGTYPEHIGGSAIYYRGELERVKTENSEDKNTEEGGLDIGNE